jgi:Rrf2 family protein
MFSQTAEYALRAVVSLADSDQPLTTQQLAALTQVPADYLSKVMQSLGRAGLVESQRGKNGGFKLARPASQMTILDVLNAVDPLPRIHNCPLHLKSHSRQLCPLHQRLDDAFTARFPACLTPPPISGRSARCGGHMPRPYFLAIALVSGAAVYAGLDGSYVLPLDHPAIQYSTAPVDDRAAKLGKRLASGDVKLAYDPELGYLPALLHELGLPHSSQVVVFSKTSFQAPRITPWNPRALYFDDDTSVGYVYGGDVLEIASVDPRLGVIFYTLDQEETAKPQIVRRGECLQCHQGGGTLGVPGLVVRSVYPESSGMPMFQAGGFVTDHRSPLKNRWGGYFVTGKAEPHMGNAFVDDREHPETLGHGKTTDLADLTSKFNTAHYLTPYSDAVALMVLEHQTRMTNLLTRVNYETRLALHDQAVMDKVLGKPGDQLSESTQSRIKNATETLLEYMLFADEAALNAPVQGSTSFAADYQERGPRSKDGRSLRDLDLKTRLLRYPCSPLIYSAAFDELPIPAKDRIYRRLWETLSGKDDSKTYARLSPADRRAVLEILRDTKPDLPGYWK